nr:rhomboid family intramembrane serine protease [Lachnospiraceae bacterium]
YLKEEWYRFFTSVFIHFDLGHIFGNMIGLWGGGRIIEKEAGHLKMMVCYFFSAIMGSLFVCLMADSGSITVGASGGVLGVIASAFIFMRKKGQNKQQTLGILFCLVYNLYNTFKYPEISVGGHVGGIIGGLLAGLVLFGKRRENDDQSGMF